MIDEGTYNELDRYFHSQMNTGEKAAFESQLNANEELRAELVWLNAMMGGMHQQGRSVMKQTIASAIAGVPMKEVSKYKPSVNGKSFLKKWWWAIAVTVAVAAAAYVYANTSTCECGDYHFFGDPHHQESNEVSVTKAMLIADSSAEEETIPDSCLDEVVIPADSAPGNINEKVEVELSGDQRHGFNDGSNRDSPRIIGYSETQVDMPKIGVPKVGASRKVNMNTSIVRRTQPPYEYKLDETLTLYANYTTTAGFVFEGTGDTVYMTDNGNQVYMLLRGKGTQSLKPIAVGPRRGY